MAVQKRYFDENQENPSYLRCFHSDKNTARFVIENDNEVESIVDLTFSDLELLILNLYEIKNEIAKYKKEVENG